MTESSQSVRAWLLHSVEIMWKDRDMRKKHCSNEDIQDQKSRNASWLFRNFTILLYQSIATYSLRCKRLATESHNNVMPHNMGLLRVTKASLTMIPKKKTESKIPYQSIRIYCHLLQKPQSDNFNLRQINSWTNETRNTTAGKNRHLQENFLAYHENTLLIASSVILEKL